MIQHLFYPHYLNSDIQFIHASKKCNFNAYHMESDILCVLDLPIFSYNQKCNLIQNEHPGNIEMIKHM